MKFLVTGAAGFIGSHLCERLLEMKHEVVGLDCFIDYYPRELKERNLDKARNYTDFQFQERDLRTDDLAPALEGVDVVYHLAAMPGLVKSWTHFDLYQSCNITATHRLLEACRQQPTLNRFVYGSTSSVYGKNACGDESLPTHPFSPYGVTKLAGEHLARAYRENFGTPVVVLRFFSVYGPRQRPDMAYNIFIRSLLENQPITVYGDGEQMRGNTFVTDCVEGVIAARNAPAGGIFNIGGGEPVRLNDVLHKLEAISGRTFTIIRKPARDGDQRETFANTTKLQKSLGWQPKVGFDEGLQRQFEWQSQSNA